MSEHVHLVGAESVRSAGHEIREAAERMGRVAAGIDEAVRLFGQHVEELTFALREHAERVEAAMRSPEQPPGEVRT